MFVVAVVCLCVCFCRFLVVFCFCLFVYSTHKGVNQRSKDVTQVQQQRPEWPSVTPTWHECKYEVHKLRHKYILWMKMMMI